MSPKRGEIWWVQFDPSIGSEIQKTRPAVVISSDVSNVHINRFQVIPVTSKVDRVYPGEALLQMKQKKGKAMANQLTTASVDRFVEKYSDVHMSEMILIERAVRTQLGL